MGAHGPAIFSDDTASDVRGDYRELLDDQVPDDEATARVIEAYQHLGDDEEHQLWLALAAAQSSVGRLDDEVKGRALDVIDTGRGLELWEEAGPTALGQRRAALAKLRQQLTGPQPTRKTLRRPWRNVTDLRTGDVLAFTASNGALALLRVGRIDDHRLGVAPIVVWMDWDGRRVPPSGELDRVPDRLQSRTLGMPPRPDSYRISRHRKKDPDWADSGFVVAAHVAPRPTDERMSPWILTDWVKMARGLDRALTR